MRKILVLLLLSIVFVTPSYGNDISNLEEIVSKRVESDPATASEHFFQQIEAGANAEEQAVYLYGMGLVNERLGNVTEAINDYMATELLGNKKAKYALITLRKKEKLIHQP